jgi:DNA-binding NarL/FixJ family response regulator
VSVTSLRPVPDVETRILLVCAGSLMRAGYRAVLEADRRLTVTAEADGADEAVELAREMRPDVVLIDVTGAGGDCVRATAELAADPAAPVLLLSGSEDDQRVFDALRAGATGVLLKDTAPDALRRAVDATARGDAVLSPSLTRRLIAELVARPEPSRPSDDRLAALTTREREVVALVALGLSNEEIAGQLVVSPATARTHVSRAMVKLRARDRAQLVVFAYESRLVLQPRGS